MSGHHHQQKIPLPILWSAAALIAFSLLAGTVGRLYGAGAPEPIVDVIADRDLRFLDRADGGIDVFDARSGVALEGVEPGTNGFLRATLRGLARDRKRQGGTADEPYRLAERPDGRLTLSDPSTGRQVELDAFGATNSGAFKKFLAGATKPLAVKVSAVQAGG